MLLSSSWISSKTATGYHLGLCRLLVIFETIFPLSGNTTLSVRQFLELLQDHRVEELDVVPDVVNPLSVSVQACSKKRLILDLRHINLHIYKFKFKCEGLHTIREIFSRDYFVFSFDLKSGYHHVDIFPEHQKFLAFSWDFDSRA